MARAYDTRHTPDRRRAAPTRPTGPGLARPGPTGPGPTGPGPAVPRQPAPPDPPGSTQKTDMSDSERLDPAAAPVLDLAAHPAVRGLLASEVPATSRRERISTRVASDDEMLLFSLETRKGDFDLAAGDYAQSGARIVASLRQLMTWRFGGFAHIGRYLDFASGWGRVTRFLLGELSPEQLWVADIIPSAVTFQQRELGVHTLLSASEPQAFSPGIAFDCIVVTSLFTHLPEPTFRRWLAQLAAQLAPGGMLVVSAHDTSLLPADWVLPPGGLFFLPLSESRGLDKEEYGSTWVEPSFVAAVVADTARELGTPLSLHRLARGYCNFHDLYLIVRESDVDFSSLVFERDPEGFLDRASETETGELVLQGWCGYPEAGAGIAASDIARVELVVDGAVVATASELWHRPDVAAATGRPDYLRSGFELRWRPQPTTSRTATPLVVRAVTRRGLSGVLWVGTAAMALLQTAHLQLAGLATERDALQATLESETTRLGDALAASTAQTAHLEVQVTRLHEELAAACAVATGHGASIDNLSRQLATVSQRLATIEASRFWALRERWWQLKRAAGGGPDPLASPERGSDGV